MELMQACAQVKKRLEQLDFHSFGRGLPPVPLQYMILSLLF